MTTDPVDSSVTFTLRDENGAVGQDSNVDINEINKSAISSNISSLSSSTKITPSSKRKGASKFLSKVTSWNIFKEIVYSTLDTVTGATAKVYSLVAAPEGPPPTVPVAFGYSDTVEQARQKDSNNKSLPFPISTFQLKSQSLDLGNRIDKTILTMIKKDEEDTKPMETKEEESYSTANLAADVISTFQLAASPIADIATAEPKEDTPGSRLLRQYKASLPGNYESNLNNNLLTQDTKDSNENLPLTSPYEEDLYKNQAQKAFDSVKEGLYGVLDSLRGEKDKTNEINNNIENKGNIPNTNAQFTSSYSSPTAMSSPPVIRAVAKPSINNDQATTELTPYLQELSSPDPIVRIKATLAIKAAESKRKRNEENAKRKDFLDNVKSTAFASIDTVQATTKAIGTIPSTVETKIEESIELAENLKTKVQSIPSEVSNTIETTQETTNQIIQEVTAIPKKVETTIDQTTQSILSTKEAIEAIPTNVSSKITEVKQTATQITQSIEDLTYEAKVLTGIEKRKPKPPPPPPVRTNSEIVTEFTTKAGWFVAKNTGKTAWFLTKGAVSLGASGAKIAYRAVIDRNSKKDNLTAPNPALERNDVTEAVLELEEDILSLAEVDPSLEKEVMDALRMANEALNSSAKFEERKKEQDKAILEISQAMKKAKEAAKIAQNEAKELEDMVRQMKKDDSS
eukprot:CAMPEP_0184871824 /NCGR_PEP_ID=MMETSP0580-20130426/40940_1 /TAXON_ID=1118495 /ORGANISM="Dactyliosolen fragilissimus" /LENGTH=684 /DNA_ID=CAMNT_0027374535 /DNA_START=973 /DNA_END=3027 /DNA_ORIENTATION=-